MFVEHKEAGEVTEIQTKPASLSQAIRLGCKLAPKQISGVYVDSNGGACAMGAAFLALGIDYRCGWDQVVKRFGLPWLLHNDIAALNDKGQTRESIADWLEAQGY